MARRRRRSPQQHDAPPDGPDAVGLGNLQTAPDGKLAAKHPVTMGKVTGFLAALVAALGLVWGTWTIFVEADQAVEAEMARARASAMLDHLAHLCNENPLVHDVSKNAMAALPTIHPRLTQRGFLDNGINTPIEVLCASLRLPGNFVESLEGDLLRTGDTDGDGQFEYVDENGCPIVYVPLEAMETYTERPPTYRRADGSAFRPRPWRKYGLSQISRYQVYTLGPDGEPNTKDDLLRAR